MNLKVLNWNVGGGKYLEMRGKKAKDFRAKLNRCLRALIREHKPDVVALQEVVRSGKSAMECRAILDRVPSYRSYIFDMIDTTNHAASMKWQKGRAFGKGAQDPFFSQGLAIMFRDSFPHFPVWSLQRKPEPFDARHHFIENINLGSGLYFGDRNTEPRSALVAHFIQKGNNGKPLDIFLVNTHLTTLRTEREGIPRVDSAASKERLSQLEVIFDKIISRYNTWRADGYLVRGKCRPKAREEQYNRLPPVWIIAGDLNFTPESQEFRYVVGQNFIDVMPNRGTGTKAKGPGRKPTLTVDYIFAGPQYVSLDPLITRAAIAGNPLPIETVDVSDHYPLLATIPMEFEKITD